MTTASGLALIGALTALMAAFLALGKGEEPLYEVITIGLMMLVAVMFLAIAGSLGTNSPLTWRASMFFIFLTGATIVVTFLFGKTVNDILALVQIIIILAVAVLVSGKRSSAWIELNRVA